MSYYQIVGLDRFAFDPPPPPPPGPQDGKASTSHDSDRGHVGTMDIPSAKSYGSYSTFSCCCLKCLALGPWTFPSAIALARRACTQHREDNSAVKIGSTANPNSYFKVGMKNPDYMRWFCCPCCMCQVAQLVAGRSGRREPQGKKTWLLICSKLNATLILFHPPHCYLSFSRDLDPEEQDPEVNLQDKLIL